LQRVEGEPQVKQLRPLTTPLFTGVLGRLEFSERRPKGGGPRKPARPPNGTVQTSEARSSGWATWSGRRQGPGRTSIESRRKYKVRRVVSRGSPSHQLGHYEMMGKPGARRSVFKVLVHLGEHAMPEAALDAWRHDVERARSAGREKTAARIEEKIRKLEGAISERTEAR